MEMKDYSNSTIEKLPLIDGIKAILRLETLPQDVDMTIKAFGNEYTREDLEDLMYDKIEDFFSVEREDYKKLIGRCFFCKVLGTAIKVLDVPEDREEYEFIYESFQSLFDGKNWDKQDYYWLQDSDGFEKYRITPYAEMNIASESMIHLGKDGKLYVDYTCSSDFVKFEEISLTKYNNIRKKALQYEM